MLNCVQNHRQRRTTVIKTCCTQKLQLHRQSVYQVFFLLLRLQKYMYKPLNFAHTRFLSLPDCLRHDQNDAVAGVSVYKIVNDDLYM